VDHRDKFFSSFKAVCTPRSAYSSCSSRRTLSLRSSRCVCTSSWSDDGKRATPSKRQPTVLRFFRKLFVPGSSQKQWVGPFTFFLFVGSFPLSSAGAACKRLASKGLLSQPSSGIRSARSQLSLHRGGGGGTSFCFFPQASPPRPPPQAACECCRGTPPHVARSCVACALPLREVQRESAARTGPSSSALGCHTVSDVSRLRDS